MTTSDPNIGRRSFTDGITRGVFADATGQYVLGDDRRMVRGVWLVTDQDEKTDVPVLVAHAYRLRGSQKLPSSLPTGKVVDG